MKKILPSIIILLSFAVILPAPGLAAEENTSIACQTSDRVKTELEQMSRDIRAASGALKNQCGQGTRRALKGAYFQFLDVGVNINSMFFGIKSLRDAGGNHALAHDLKAYKEKLDQLDELAKRALSYCDTQGLTNVKNLKTQYRSGSQEAGVGGYEALRQAQRPDRDNLFYQNGFYTQKSNLACSDKDYNPDDLKKVFQRFKDNLNNMWDRQQQLKPKSAGQLRQEFYDDQFSDLSQGLISIEVANETASPEKDGKKSFDSYFENIWTNLKQEVAHTVKVRSKSRGEIQQDLQAQGQKNISQEQLETEKQISDSTAFQTTQTEERRAKYKLLYNQVAQPLNGGIYGILAQTDQLIVSQKDGQNKLCSLVEQSALALSNFCKNVVPNKGGICEDYAAHTVCR